MDLTEMHDFTPEQQALMCRVICLRLARDKALPRKPIDHQHVIPLYPQERHR